MRFLGFQQTEPLLNTSRSIIRMSIKNRHTSRFRRQRLFHWQDSLHTGRSLQEESLSPATKCLSPGSVVEVALFALSFAIAQGAVVYVTSGQDSKIANAVGLGAQGGVNYHDTSWVSELKKTAGEFDVIIDSAAWYPDSRTWQSLRALVAESPCLGVPPALFIISVRGPSFGNNSQYTVLPWALTRSLQRW